VFVWARSTLNGVFWRGKAALELLEVVAAGDDAAEAARRLCIDCTDGGAAGFTLLHVASEAGLGLGRSVSLYYCSSVLYQMH
jgi:hypothetical protein